MLRKFLYEAYHTIDHYAGLLIISVVCGFGFFFGMCFAAVVVHKLSGV